MGTKTIIVCCILLISMLLLAGCHVWKGKKKPEEPIATEPPLPSAIARVIIHAVNVVPILAPIITEMA